MGSSGNGHDPEAPLAGEEELREREPAVALVHRQETIPSTAVSMESSPALAVAVQAKAAVESRYLMAMQNPRRWEVVRLKILDACRRPRFAEQAKYAKPVGNGKVVGPSIRFAEEALRAMGNCLVETMVIQEDDEQRIVRVSVTDLESNLSYPQDVVVRKEVERKSLREGQVSKGKRLNSSGQTVYLVAATDDELLVKQNALTSKAIRGGGLRILPSDILEEAMEQVSETVEKKDASDPAGARKRVIDLFHKKGVEPPDLIAYLGHPIEQMTTDELQELKLSYTALSEGETTWQAIMETRWGEQADAQQARAQTKAKAEELRGKMGLPPTAPVVPNLTLSSQEEEAKVREEEQREAAKEKKGQPRRREPGE